MIGFQQGAFQGNAFQQDNTTSDFSSVQSSSESSGNPKTLHKDVKLMKTDNGHYDISIKNGDYEIVEGRESLQNAALFAILLHFNELNLNPTYQNRGNRAYFYIKDRNIALSRLNIQESIKEALEDVRRIKTVNYVTVNPVNDNSNKLKVNISLTGLNDEEIEMEARIW